VEIQLFPIVSPCDLKLVLAPAIVNYTPSAYNTVMVGSHSTQTSCMLTLDIHYYSLSAYNTVIVDSYSICMHYCNNRYTVEQMLKTIDVAYISNLYLL